MFAQLALLGFAVTASVDRPKVEVWTNRRDDPYTSGQAVRVYFQTDQDAYVTLLRVDTDGRVRVLFPRQPWEDNFAHGGRVYEVASLTSREAFDVDDYPGVGYLFAVAAADPFSYDPIESAEHWDYRSIANDGRIRGDPYVALTDLAQRIVPPDYETGTRTPTPASASASWCTTTPTITHTVTMAAPAWCSPGRIARSPGSFSRIARAARPSSPAWASVP